MLIFAFKNNKINLLTEFRLGELRMLIKNLVAILLFIATLSLSMAAFAEQTLTKSIADIFRTNHYLIRYRLFDYIENMHPAAKAALKDKRTEITLIQSGDNALHIMECYSRNNLYLSSVNLLINGECYFWSTQGNKKAINLDYTPTKDATVFKQTGDSENMSKTTFESAYSGLMYHLLPVIPERNKTKTLNGEEAQLNHCSVFSKIGEEKIGENILQFEEYKTPEGSEMPAVARYYFDNGKFVKYIRFSEIGFLNEYKEGDTLDENETIIEAEMLNGQKIKYKQKSDKGYTMIDVYEFKGDFDESCLSIPKDKKIYGYNPATMKITKPKKEKKN